jgi:signal transduction histidine kinase
MLNFFDTIPIPTIVVNNENKIVFINQIGLQFLELPNQDIVLKPVIYLFPEIELGKLKNKEYFTTSYKNSIGVNKFINIQFDSSTIQNIEYKLFYLKEFSSKDSQYFSINNTDSIELQNKLLINQNKELEQFTHIISHDLQEPLISLIGYSKLLEEEYQDKFDEEGKMFVQFINKSAIRMQNLISGLAQLSRINKREAISLTDISILIKEVKDDLSHKINKYNAIITFENLPSINCYPTYIRLLFQNLISNAIKFSKKRIQPKIQISCFEREIDWLFQIKDNGIGIDSNNSQQIFLIFKRLHSDQDYSGFGIGLAHCKKIIEIHNGEIWVDSILGEGSTFNFTIPKKI